MNIVLLNGGRGGKAFIEELLKRQDCKIFSIVNAYDDGKSTGILRNFFNILGPSDIRKVHSSLLDRFNPNFKIFKQFYDYRFKSNISNKEAKSKIYEIANFINNEIINLKIIDIKKGKKISKYLNFFLKELIKKENQSKILFNFKDCSAINCLYASIIYYHDKDVDKAISIIEDIFDIKHQVIINSNSNRYLYAIRSNGEILSSESEIVEIRSNESINNIYLLKKKIDLQKIKKLSIKDKHLKLEKNHSSPKLNLKVKSVLKNSDYIFFCPGTQHSSLYPTYLTKGFLNAIQSSESPKIFITNIGADYETPFYKASDYVIGAIKYLNKNNKKYQKKIFDIFFINKPSSKFKNYVTLDLNKFNQIDGKLFIDDFDDPLKNGHHNAKKIINLIL